MNNSGYDVDGVSLFDVNPIEEAINSNDNTVKTFGNQTISGDKTFTGTVVLENEIIHNSTSFSTEDGIIEQLKGNTGDLLDYGNYAVYNDGVSTKYKGIINKKQTDKFYVFHNQTNQPTSSLNLSTQDLGSLVVREPVEDDEVATKAYVESHGGGNYLPLSGGTMSGNINMDKKTISNASSIGLTPTTAGGNTNLDFTSGDSGRGKLFISGIGRFEVSTSNQEFTRVEFNVKLKMTDKIYFSSPYKIEGLADGTVSGDAVNKGQLDTKLNLSGGTMSGNIDLGGNDLINCDIVRPSGGSSLQLLSQNQAGGIRIFDTLVDIFSDVRMNNNNISFLGEPTLSHQATTKQYVDNAVNGGGDVHLPKYHTVFFAPSPDSGQDYKTYTNDGFFGQAVFQCQSPVMSTTSGYVLWNINTPPLFFMDALVDFSIRIKEGNTYVETIQCGATYNDGFIGSGYNTIPTITKGCHEIQTTDPTVILGVEVWCKPRTAINGTARLSLTSNGSMFQMYRVADFELININP